MTGRRGEAVRTPSGAPATPVAAVVTPSPLHPCTSSLRRLAHTRRGFLARGLLACGLGAAAGLRGPRLSAARADEAANRRLYTEPIAASVQRGLAWLAGQQEEDGTFGSRSRYRQNIGVNALAGLAFMSGGNLPSGGAYRTVVAKVLDYILGRSLPSGYIVEERSDYDHGPMYGHGFGTLFLGEIFGMTSEKTVGERLRQAVDLIVATQNGRGGWRYHPIANDADVSVTVCQLMALRSARNTGVAVPRETVDRAVEYILSLQNDDGGFSYRREERTGSAFARSAAAVVALYNAGRGDARQIVPAIAYLARFRPDRLPDDADVPYFHYGHYYAAQAFWHAGSDAFQVWYPPVAALLVQAQGEDGSWSDSTIGPVYTTAMSCLALLTPVSLLPIYER